MVASRGPTAGNRGSSGLIFGRKIPTLYDNRLSTVACDSLDS